MDEYYTIKTAADLLGVSALTLRNWDKQGKLIAYRHPINNYRLYKRGEVEALIQKMGRRRDEPKKIAVRVLEDGELLSA